MPNDGNSGGIDRAGVFAHGAQAQAEAGAKERPPGDRHHCKPGVDEDVVAGDQVGVDRTEERDVLQGLCERKVNRLEPSAVDEWRCLSALLKEALPQKDGQA